MYQIEKMVDSKWKPQGKLESLDSAIKEVELYAHDHVDIFKTCDAFRAVDLDTKKVVKVYPVEE